MRKTRVGPAMRQLLQIIHTHFGNRAPSRSAAYTHPDMGYHGSNRHGDAVMQRLETHGLVERLEARGNVCPVTITEAGLQALE